MNFLHRNPAAAKIEITRRCNLNCPMCLRPSLPVYPDITLQNFLIILNQLKKTPLIMSHLYGEPTLHPQFLQLMWLIAEKGKKSQLTTNGTLFTKKTREGYLALHPLAVTFSFDAGTKKKYEEIRKGANFEVTTENIRQTVLYRNRKHLKTKIIIDCTLGEWNKDQIIPLADLGAQLGVDLVNFSGLTLHGYGLATKENVAQNLDFNYVKEHFNVDIAHPVVDNRLVCNRLWTETCITANGDVFPCADIMHMKLGNVFETSFKEIWNGTTMKNLRKKFHRDPLDECKRCASNMGARY